MASQQPIEGMRVTIWARPMGHVLLVFGHGVYAGTEYVNGQNSPVIHLDNGKQTVLIWQNVNYGAETNVSSAIATFKQAKGNVVLNWSLDDFIVGKLPDPETVAVEVPDMPNAPKTAVDAFHKKLALIEAEEKMIAAYQKGIDSCRVRIEGHRRDLLSQRELLLKELSALDKIVAANPTTPVPEMKVPDAKPASIEVVEQSSQYDLSAARAALED